MRFKKFITEEELDLPSKCKIIKQNCSQFLKEAGEHPLYRGQKTTRFENDSQALRKTRDSLPWTVGLFNLYMEEKFKIKNARNKHAIFTNGSPDEVKMYGDISFFFPTDGYQYFWSPIVRDFLGRENIIWGQVFKEVIKHFPDEAQEAMSILQDAFTEQPHVTIKEAVSTHANLFRMKSGKNAYALVRKCMMDVYDDLEYSQKYIKSAITGQTEMVFNTKKYYLLYMGDVISYFNDQNYDKFEYESSSKQYEEILKLINGS